jgi:Fis family transcriptional regulator
VEQPLAESSVSSLVTKKSSDTVEKSIPGRFDPDLERRLDNLSIEDVVEMKISRFLDQLGSFYPNDLHEMIISKVERPLLNQILRRVGGNQVHASRILGINRNTLRKKIKLYSL